MPDKNGQPIKKGDLVSVLFEIEECSADQDYCNCTIKTVDPMPGNGSQSVLTLNTRQVSRVSRAGETTA